MAAIDVARSLRRVPPDAAPSPPITRYLQALMDDDPDATGR
jgi:hypothetical protein